MNNSIESKILSEKDNKDEKLEINKVYNEDCIVGMKKIKDESVDIIICDPPYNIGKISEIVVTNKI